MVRTKKHLEEKSSQLCKCLIDFTRIEANIHTSGHRSHLLRLSQSRTLTQTAQRFQHTTSKAFFHFLPWKQHIYGLQQLTKRWSFMVFSVLNQGITPSSSFLVDRCNESIWWVQINKRWQSEKLTTGNYLEVSQILMRRRKKECCHCKQVILAALEGLEPQKIFESAAWVFLKRRVNVGY